MPPNKLEDLPADIREIVGTPAKEGACISEQPVCHPDSRVTAQLTDEPPPPYQVLPWRILNADKGNLILAPGGPAGLIGGLLSQLDPPQLYSHMGLMIDDQLTLRQALSIGDRAQHKHFARGPELFGEQFPVDGYDEDAMRYQWPGTLTQSFEEAYVSVREHPIQPKANKDDPDVPLPQRLPL